MMIYTGAIIFPAFSSSLLLWTELVGPPGQLMILAYAYIKNARSNILLLCLLEIIGMKAMTWKVWKSIPPINEDFFACFLWKVNLVLGGFYGIVMVMVNNRLFQDTEVLGQFTSEQAPMDYELTLALATFTAICLMLMVSLIQLKAI